MESMKEAWHNHPYIIMGLGAIIVAYFLWPSKTATGSNATDPQLAAETALAQQQLADQAQTNQAQIAANAGTAAARATAEGQSNAAVAAANAAAVVSYNQTAQAGIAGQAAVAQSYNNAENTDFAALLGGLTSFGNNSAAGAKDASQLGLWGYLASIGAKFSGNQDGINIDQAAPASQWANNSSGASSSFQSGTRGFAGGMGGNSGWWGGWGTYPQSGSSSWTSNNSGFSAPNWFAEPYITTVGAADSPFARSDNLLGSLWSNVINRYNARPGPISSITLPAVQTPTLAGAVQPIA